MCCFHLFLSMGNCWVRPDKPDILFFLQKELRQEKTELFSPGRRNSYSFGVHEELSPLPSPATGVRKEHCDDCNSKLMANRRSILFFWICESTLKLGAPSFLFRSVPVSVAPPQTHCHTHKQADGQAAALQRLLQKRPCMVFGCAATRVSPPEMHPASVWLSISSPAEGKSLAVSPRLQNLICMVAWYRLRWLHTPGVGFILPQGHLEVPKKLSHEAPFAILKGDPGCSSLPCRGSCSASGDVLSMSLMETAFQDAYFFLSDRILDLSKKNSPSANESPWNG